MKKLLILFFVSAALNAMAQDTAQKNPRSVSQTMDLVVEIPRLDDENFRTISAKLTKLNSMSVEGFCKSEKLIYLRFNPEQYFNVLVSINEAGYAYYIKRNTSIAKGVEACADKTQLYMK